MLTYPDVSTALAQRDCNARTINSTAFPNVAFRSPPIVSPSFSEISSVAKERTAARGMMAKKLMVKTADELQPSMPAMMPKGTIGRRKLT